MERFIANTCARETNPTLVIGQILKVRGYDIDLVEKGLGGSGIDLEGFVALTGDQTARELLFEVSQTPIFELLAEADTFGNLDADSCLSQGIDQTVVQKIVVFSLERAAAKDEEMVASL